MARHEKATRDKQEAESRRSSRASNRRDHRAALQANKLRMGLATKAMCFGMEEPVVALKRMRILVISLIIACVLLVATIGAAKIIQML